MVEVAARQCVGDDIVVVLEAVKMLHSLAAAGHGMVEAIHVEAGTAVESGATLVTIEIGTFAPFTMNGETPDDGVMA